MSNPTLLGIIAASRKRFVGPLDGYTTGLWSAMSVRRLLSSWSGAGITVRNSGTGAISDIGFDSLGAISASELLTFLGSNSGTARAWINQQGVAPRGVDNATPAGQPACATAGVFDGELVFNGTANLMPSGTASGSVPAFTVFFRGRLRSTAGTQVILEQTTNYNSTNGAVVYYDAGALSVGVHRNSPVGYSRSDFSGSFPNNNVHCWRFDRSQLTSAAMTTLFINGTQIARSGNGDSGTLPSGNFDAANWFFGARSGALLPSQLNAHTLLIYEASLSNSDVASISAILASLP